MSGIFNMGFLNSEGVVGILSDLTFIFNTIWPLTERQWSFWRCLWR